MIGMGRGLGGLARILGLGLLVGLLAPVLALAPAMVVDRGGDGSARVSAFPAALVVLDPLIWRCVRNSVVVALGVTVGSLGIGTALGMILGRRRFWGRWSLGRLALLPLAVGPIGMTPGVVVWIGADSRWEWLAARTFFGQPGDEWARWFALVWVGITASTPLVILAVHAGLVRVDPAWADAARVVGASRWRVWLDVTWPTLRPELAAVAATIFALVLVEPAGPTILGLRRTLVVAMSDAAFRYDEPNRAATLATIAVVIALAARGLLVRWGGSTDGTPGERGGAGLTPRAGFRLGGCAVAVLIAWAVVALGPAITFGRRLATAALRDQPPSWPAVRSIVAGWTAPEMTTWVANSALTASLAVGLDLLLLAWLTTGARWATRWLTSVPPLALAVGALAIPWLLATWADATGWPILAGGLRLLRTELSPGRSPGFLLVLVLAATALPFLARSAGADDPAPRPAAVDAALLAGATPRAAARLAAGRSRIWRGRPLVIAWTWASTDLASAWTLTTLDERRTIAPAALHLVGVGAEPLDPRLLGLVALLVTVRIVGLAFLAGASRPPRPGTRR